MGEVKEVTPVSEKEFESHIRNTLNLQFRNTLNLQYFECTKRFKSIGRAFRRGHITNFGFILPNRPYNNKKHTEGRKDNIEKKRLWQKITGKKVM